MTMHRRSRSGQRGLTFKILPFVIAALAIAAGLLSPSATQAAPYDLLLSFSADRSSPQVLDGQQVSGNIYVFTKPDTGVSQVRFFLNDPGMNGTPFKIENNAPYDFNGTASNGNAFPFNTETIPDGIHEITAQIILSGSAGTEVVHGTFHVLNNDPALLFDPQQVTLVALVNGGVAQKTVQMNTNTFQPTPFSITSNASWLSASPDSGETPDDVVVSVDTTGLPLGVFTSSLTATSSEVDPATLEVTLHVRESIEPDQVHLAWVEDTSTTLNVVWRTWDTSVPSMVQYRPAGTWTWQTATGGLRPSGTSGTLHEVMLTSLTPDTAYEYQVLGDGEQWSQVYTTRTGPPLEPSSFDAIYVADTGLIGRLDGLATGTEQVIDEIANLNPSLVLLGGDYAYFNTDKRFGTLDNTIDAWFNQMHPVATQSPMMPVYGNHEVLLGEGFGEWAARFPTPEGFHNRRNYSFQVGEVQFIAILAITDTGGLSSGTLNWIEQEIIAAKNAGKRWIIPYMHASAYGDGMNHPSNPDLRAQLGPLFEQHGIKIVLTSHDQAYERSYPLSDMPVNNVPTSQSLRCYTMDDGTTWVKSSPGGKLSNKNSNFSQFATDPAPAWTAVRNNTMHNFARLNVKADGSLTVETYGVVGDGSPPVIIDTFTYTTGACTPELVFSESLVSLSTADDETVTAEVELSTTDGSSVGYILDDDASWLTVEADSSSTPATLTLTADSTGLDDGAYVANVTATADGYLADTLQVRLQVGHPYSIMLSYQPNRSGPVPLKGQAVAGNIYVFTAPDAGVSKVDFYLNNPNMVGSPFKVENNVPYDFAGTASNGTAHPYNSANLPDGPHTISARMFLTNNETLDIHASFAVANEAPALVVTPPEISLALEPGDTASASVDLTASDLEAVEFSLSGGADWLEADPTAGTTPASIDLSIDTAGLPGGTHIANVMAESGTHVSASLSVTVTIVDPDGCEPLPCSEIMVDLPYVLDYTSGQDHGKIPDGSGVGTGFTYVDPPSKGVGYRPERLQVDATAGTFNITTTSGLAFSSANSQDNTLGVGFSGPSQVALIETKLVNLPAASGSFEQAGLWFGVDEDNYIKLVVLSVSSTGSRIQRLMEVDGSTASVQQTGVIGGLAGSTVALTLVADPVAGTATAFYSINGGAQQSLGTFPVPAKFFSMGDATINPAIGTGTFAGIFASHRNASSPLTYKFQNFSVIDESADDPSDPPDDKPETEPLVFTPTSVSFALEPGESAQQSVSLGTGDSAPADFTISGGADWLEVAPLSSTTPEILTLTADATDVDSGTHVATLTASSDTHTSASLTVTLSVVDPDGCEPLPCSDIMVDLPYEVNYATLQDHGKIPDGNGVGTGFTYVDPPSKGTGYIPARLNVDQSAGTFNITTTSGLAIGSVNSQDNTLGVGFSGGSQVAAIQTTMVNLPGGTGHFQQGGLWFGADEDNYIKLVVLSTNSSGLRIQRLMEVNGSTAASQQTSVLNIIGSTVTLRLVANPYEGTVQAFYKIDGGSEQLLGTFTSVPAKFFSLGDATVNPAIGTGTFAGIFASHRNGSSPLTFKFQNFSVIDESSEPSALVFNPSSVSLSLESGETAAEVVALETNDGSVADFNITGGADWLEVLPLSGTTTTVLNLSIDTDGLPKGTHVAFLTASSATHMSDSLSVTLTIADPDGCEPLPCSQIKVDLPYEINYASLQDHGKIPDGSGVGTGFTYVGPPSKGTGYIPARLNVDQSAGRLNIATTSGLAFGSSNSQDNTLGIGYAGSSHVARIQTTLVDIPAGTGNFEQAGLWFGADEDNYIKLVVVSTSSNGMRIQRLMEVNGSTVASQQTNVLPVIGSTVALRLVADPFSGSVAASYSIDGGAFQNLVTFTNVPLKFFSLGDAEINPAIGTGTFAGIFASHRNASSPLTFKFRDFSVMDNSAESPSLVFVPGTVELALDPGGSTAHTVNLTTNNGVPANFQLAVSAGVTWLEVAPTAGTTPIGLNVSIDAGDLPEGMHIATVTAAADTHLSATLTVRLTVGDSGSCQPVACSDILIDIPYELEYALRQDFGFIPDKNGVGTGFTYIDPPSNGTGYIPDRLHMDLDAGTLNITTTSGLNIGSVNSQDNALGVGIDGPSQVTLVRTTIVDVPAATGHFQQAGVWFGIDDDNYIKLVALSTSSSAYQIERLLEVNGSTVSSQRSSNINLAGGTVTLSIVADPFNRVAAAYFSINDGPLQWLGSFPVPPEFFSFDAAGIDPEIGTRSFGGIFASHRSGPAPLTYKFTEFVVTDAPDAPPPPPTGSGDITFSRHSYSMTRPTSLTWGPDDRLYGLELFGTIRAFTFDDAKNMTGQQVISALTDSLGSRLSLGLAVDPSSTPEDVILWVSHSSPSLNNGVPNSGMISRISGPNFSNIEHVITGLPRAIANHATNNIRFGPDGKLYIAQGGNTGGGAPNTANTEFKDMAEQPLSAALLVADVYDPNFDGSCNNPEDIFGPPPCDVVPYATGLRNAYDFVFHTNGSIYAPDNGLSVKSTYPPSPEPPCTGMADTSLHSPPEQQDLLLRIEEGKYYGHPNPYRDECVFYNGSLQGVPPLPNYALPIANLGKNRSANGTIEYLGDAFCGSLKHNLVIANYSVGNDLTRVQLSPDGTIVTSLASLVGGFNDPLPVAQDPDGVIYVGEFGGNKLTVLKPNDIGCWTRKANMPASLLDPAGAALDGKMYVVAGKTNTGPKTDMYIYDPVADTWSMGPNMPGVGVEDMALVAYDGKLWGFGGATQPFSGAVNQAASYNPATNSWTSLAPMPTARGGVAAVVLNNKIYVIGGMDGTGASVDIVEVYDPATNTWSSIASMDTRRDNPGAAALDGKIYVFGGRTRNASGATLNGTLNTVEVYDPATNTWAYTTPMPTGRRTMVVGLLNGRAQLIGGEITSAGGSFAANEEFNPATGSWRILRTMDTPRHGSAAATIGNVIYVAAGGTTGGSSFSNILEAFQFMDEP